MFSLILPYSPRYHANNSLFYHATTLTILYTTTLIVYIPMSNRLFHGILQIICAGLQRDIPCYHDGGVQEGLLHLTFKLPCLLVKRINEKQTEKNQDLPIFTIYLVYWQNSITDGIQMLPIFNGYLEYLNEWMIEWMSKRCTLLTGHTASCL